MPPVSKPFFRFTHSKVLRARTLKILDAIDRDADPVAHRDALSDIISQLSAAGMRFFFLDPLATLKMGFVVNQAAALGIGSVLRIMAPTINNVVARMDARQLRQVALCMRRMMV